MKIKSASHYFSRVLLTFSSRPPTPAELLDSVGYMRGFMTRHGIPDRSRCARLVLADYLAVPAVPPVSSSC